MAPLNLERMCKTVIFKMGIPTSSLPVKLQKEVQHPCCFVPNGNLSEAMFQNHYDCVEYAMQQGAKFNTEALNASLKSGNIEFIEYALQKGCKWNNDSLGCAITGGVACVTYAITHGCAPKAKGKWNTRILNMSLSHGNIECVIYARAKKIRWNNDSMMFAMLSGDLVIAKYALVNGARWDNSMWGAIFSNKLEMVQFAHVNGCPWSVASMRHILSVTNVEILKYAYRIVGLDSIFRDRYIWKMITVGKSLDFIKYAHETMRCSLGSNELESAMGHGSLDIVKYIRSKGVAWTYECRVRAYERRNYVGVLECYKYAVANGILD